MRIGGFLLMVILSLPLWAQHPCNGRYTDSLFSTIDETIIQYGSNLNKDTIQQDLHLKIYSPAGDTIPERPLMIFIHGGSFIGGSYQSQRVVNICRYFAKRGYVTASLEYRLGIYPSNDPLQYGINWLYAVYRATQDAKAAVRFFRANPDTFSVDTSQIFVGGFSAGAATAIHAAYWDEEEVAFIDTAFWGSMNAGTGNGGNSSRVTGILGVGGAIADTNILDNDIPAIMVHGVTDGTVPIGIAPDPATGIPLYGSQAIADILDRKETYNALKVIHQNGFHVPAPGSALEDTVQQFFRDEAYKLLKHNWDSLLVIPMNDALIAEEALAYQWYYGDSLSIPNNRIITPDTTGWYSLQVINKNGCKMQRDSIYVEVDTFVPPVNVLGITINWSKVTSHSEGSFQVISIEKSIPNLYYQLWVHNIAGEQLFYAEQVSNHLGKFKFEVPMHQYVPGIYFYSLLVPTGERLNGKFYWK